MPAGSRVHSGDLHGFEDSEAGFEIDDDDYSGAGSSFISTRELVRDEFEEYYDEPVFYEEYHYEEYEESEEEFEEYEDI